MACILLGAHVGKRQMGCKGDVFPGELQPWRSFTFALTFLRRESCDICHLGCPLWVTTPIPQRRGHGGRLLPLLSPPNSSRMGKAVFGPDLPTQRLHEASCICSDPTCVSPCRKSTFAFIRRQNPKTRKQTKPQKHCPVASYNA